MTVYQHTCVINHHENTPALSTQIAKKPCLDPKKYVPEGEKILKICFFDKNLDFSLLKKKLLVYIISIRKTQILNYKDETPKSIISSLNNKWKIETKASKSFKKKHLKFQNNPQNPRKFEKNPCFYRWHFSRM